jgi:hypothetical protein
MTYKELEWEINRINSLSPMAVSNVVMGIHPDDLAKARQFAGEAGGWEQIAKMFTQIMEGTKKDMSKGMFATVIGLAAIIRSHGFKLNLGE